MIVPSKSVLATAVSVALASAVVNGHGYMSDPAVTFLSSAGDPTQFIATIEASATGWSGKFDGAPADNTAAFTTAFESSEYTSLKDVIDGLATVTVDGASLTCGSCDPDETAQPMPEEYVEWSHSDSEGFTASHEGPCEVWCDDVRVFHEDDCAATYTTAPAELPFDRDACMGSSTLTFYWLALHSSTWQVYVNCAPLEATTSTGAVSSYAVGSSTSTSTSTSSNSTTPAVTTATPAATTAAPTATTAAPAATTAAPTTTTTAPSTSTSEGSGSEDCGSLDMAESDSDCGSLDMAESESDCGSLDMAADETAGEAETTAAPSTATKGSSNTATKGSSDASTSTQQSTSTGTTTGSSEVAGDADTATDETTGDDEVAGEADTTEDDSECGSLDMAEDDSECGSLDMAEDDSECGSLDMAEDDSECGSLDMAESDESDREYTGSSNIDFSTFQGNSAVGTVAPDQE